MDFSELTAETIKIRIREEVPSRETGLPGEILRMGKMRQDRISELTARLEDSEADRAARLNQITELTGLLKDSEADRAERFRQITELTGFLKDSEADRAARLEVIRSLEENITRLQTLLDGEKRRADDCEEGWRALECTFSVRLARRIGLMKTRRYGIRGQQGAGD